MSEEKLHELANVLGHLQPHDWTTLFGIPLSSTIKNTLIIGAVLIVIVFLLTRRLSDKPKGAQNLLEMYIEFIWGMLEPSFGKEGRRYLPFIGTYFLWIATLNLSWFIPGMIPPVTDYSTPAGLAVACLLIVHFLGIRKRGLKHYLHHYTDPSPILAPLNLIEELTKPFSLSIRLFGNMFGEKMVTTVLFILAPLAAPSVVMLLGVIMGLIQAFVFTLLATTYLTTIVKGH